MAPFPDKSSAVPVVAAVALLGGVRILRGLVIVGAMMLSGNGVASADDTCNLNELVQSGTLHAHVTTVGILLEKEYGDGVLTLNNGKTYDFSITAEMLQDSEYDDINVEGEIYNLERPEDLNGTYYVSSTNILQIESLKGGVVFKNTANCVYVHAIPLNKGIPLPLPIFSGIKVRLVEYD